MNTNSNLIRLLSNKYLIVTICIFVFIATLIINIPTQILGNLINKYSEGHLQLYNQKGSFWNGEGLLVAKTKKSANGAPLILVNWDITFNFKKWVDIKFRVGNNQIAEIYLNNSGTNIDNLDVSLSISQVSNLFDIIKDMGLSGNIRINTSHININKTSLGNFGIYVDNISSVLSPVNPLGSYKGIFDIASGEIQVSTTNTASALKLSGTGNLNSLILNANTSEDNKTKLMQFLTATGMPKSDGSYDLRIF